MNYKIAKIHRACKPGLRSIAGKQVYAVLELPADFCRRHGIEEGQPVAIMDVKTAQNDESELLTPAQADFIPDFIGRQCGNCAYYKWNEQKCLIAPALTPVYPNQYCDGYYPTPLYIEQRGPVTLSRFYQTIVDGAPYEDDAGPTKDIIKFYDHIRGVSCGSCWWQDLKDESVCKIVDSMISSYCCCSFWNVGQEAGFVGLAELRSGIVHGGDMMVMNEDAYQPGGQDIERGEGEAPTTDNTEADERFKIEEEKMEVEK